MRLWKREDELERRLRSRRPEPRTDFVRSLAGLVDEAPRPRGLRFALAAVLTMVALAAFGAFGGLSYAGKAAKFGADESASHSQRANNNSNSNSNRGGDEEGDEEGDDEGDEEGEDDDDPTDDQYGGKTTICHRTSSATNPFVLISVSNNALPAHRRHGDTLPGTGGTCPGGPIP